MYTVTFWTVGGTVRTWVENVQADYPMGAVNFARYYLTRRGYCVRDTIKIEIHKQKG